MTIALVGVASSTGSSSVNKPAGVVSGDVMVLFGDHTGNSTPFSGPSGWTAVPNGSSSVSGLMVANAWYKVAGSSEPSSYSVTGGSTSGRALGIIAYSGVDTTNPIMDSNGAVGVNTGSSINAPGLTATGAAQLLSHCATAIARTLTTPTGLTSEINQTSVGGGFQLADEAIASSGSVGAQTWNASGTTDLTAISILLKAASSTTPADLTLGSPAGQATVADVTLITEPHLGLASVQGQATVNDIALVTQPHLALAAPAGVATVGNVALKAATKLALAAVSGVATVVTLPLKAPAILGLGAVSGTASSTVILATPGRLVLDAVAGTATATTALLTAAPLTLGGVQGQAATVATVSAPAPLSLATVAGTSTASANLTTPPPPVTEDDFLIRKLASLMTGRN